MKHSNWYLLFNLLNRPTLDICCIFGGIFTCARHACSMICDAVILYNVAAPLYVAPAHTIYAMYISQSPLYMLQSHLPLNVAMLMLYVARFSPPLMSQLQFYLIFYKCIQFNLLKISKRKFIYLRNTTNVKCWLIIKVIKWQTKSRIQHIASFSWNYPALYQQ